MLRFYLPLASMVALITVTHSIIDAGLARFPSPEAVIAGYAVAKSIALILENPMFMVRQTTVSLVRDRRSYHMVRAGVLSLSFVFFCLIAIVAYIPAVNHGFLRGIMGLEGDAFTQAQAALRIMPFLPMATGLRNFQQGLAILKKGNDLLPIATVFRLIYLVVFVFGIAPMFNWHGAVVGSIAFVGGLGLEMIVMSIGLKVMLGKSKGTFVAMRQSGGPAARKRLNWHDLGEFFFPLAATSLIMTGTMPLINGFIARGASPEASLAAYAVALGIGMTLTNPVNMLHQVALTYISDKDPGSAARVRRFFATATAVFAGAVAVVAFTPLGAWLLRSVIGLPEHVAAPAQSCLGFFVVVALSSAVREYVWGVLMKERKTGSIGTAKALTALVMAVFLFVGLQARPESMAVVAALAFAAGSVFEALWLVWHGRRHKAAPKAPKSPASADSPRPSTTAGSSA